MKGSTSRRLFQQLQRVLTVFRDTEGFSQRDLMATCSPEEDEAMPDRVALLRAIQCSSDAMYALLRLEAVDGAFSLDIHAKSFANAGYVEEHRSKDEIAMTRPLRTRRDLSEELDFFARLGGWPPALSARKRKHRAKTTLARKRSVSQWQAIFDTVRQAHTPWDSAAISFHRVGRFNEDHSIDIEVRATAICDLGDPMKVVVLVGSMASPLPDSARRSLETYGRSSGGHVVSSFARGGGSLVETDALSAARKCTAICEALMS